MRVIRQRGVSGSEERYQARRGIRQGRVSYREGYQTGFLKTGAGYLMGGKYIGSFSVSGDSQSSRTEFVQQQLENMHNVEKSKKVVLVISLSGVKVCSSNGELEGYSFVSKMTDWATEDLKRSLDFRFHDVLSNVRLAFQDSLRVVSLAVQDSHQIRGGLEAKVKVILQRSRTEFEESLAKTRELWKLRMAYAKQKSSQQPTFHELIERQLVEQRAKFEVYQEQASRALQQRLTEIATPTAMQRMEMRRQSSSDDLLDDNRQSKLQTVSNTGRLTVMSAPRSHPHIHPLTASPRSTSPALPPNIMGTLEVVTIRESLENNTNNSPRYKGSPVTALKDEIDRRFSSAGGTGTLDSGLGWGMGEEIGSLNRPDFHSQALPQVSRIQNRPLPAIPGENDVVYDHRASPRVRNWTSLDDDVIPNQTRSNAHPRLRDSPKRRPQRPQSEI
ncbi:hypothetical protein MAR_004927 [Mya arenaria]|uniref:Uncharacterized protein n=1 Tax=Mya arenaria TaxID=6604 RepID=A0ABY7EZP4_MYAAR|nr:hypothetical protein MAR_004927 [Mya arenaria]